VEVGGRGDWRRATPFGLLPTAPSRDIPLLEILLRASTVGQKDDKGKEEFPPTCILDQNFSCVELKKRIKKDQKVKIFTSGQAAT
jgi:hypothetical protein